LDEIMVDIRMKGRFRGYLELPVDLVGEGDIVLFKREIDEVVADDRIFDSFARHFIDEIWEITANAF